MTYRLLPIIIALVLFPAWVGADFTEEEYWAEQSFLYRFNISLHAGVVTGGYQQTTGDQPSGSGPWEIVILGPQGQALGNQRFDLGTAASVLVQYQPSGTTAQVRDPQGAVALSLNLVGSRICDEDGICESQGGEVSTNCPVDCGTYVAPDRTATITQSGGFGKKAGALLMGLALGMMGVVLMKGASTILDRRHRS